MKLRAVEVRNWTCIESLSLADLHDGVIVLHGPNRTGKSSLVQAIRSCLFDHDHDSQKREILDASPRRTKAAPHVAIEFEQAGQRYRMTKTFAKTKEGQATLEQHGSAGWNVVIRGKDASRRVRELIGVESSAAGVFQMLWLGQRDFHLPEPRDLDSTLQKALEAVLGTLITGRDIDFKNRLDKDCERWFTVKTMKDRKDSPVTRQAGELEQARLYLDEVTRQWNEAESALKQYDETVARLPELRRNLDVAEAELHSVQKECEGVRHRKSQFDLAVKSRDQCKKLATQAELRLQEFDEFSRQLGLAVRQLDDSQLELHTVQENLTQAEQEVTAAQQLAEQAERELAEHQEGRTALEDRQRLATNRVEKHVIEERIRQVDELDKQRQELEQKLVGPAVLSDKEIQVLRQQRERAAVARAELEAGEIHVRVRAKKPLSLEVTSDGAPAERVDLADSQERNWLIRQHAELAIVDSLAITIGRGKEDRNLETLARELAENERSFRETLITAQVDPNDPAALDQLVARRLLHDEYTKQLKAARDSITRSAPNGIPSLRAELQQKLGDRQTVLARRPELGVWEPEQSDMDRLRLAFDDAEAKLRSAVEVAKQAMKRLSESLHQTRQNDQVLRTRIAGQQVQVDTLKERIEQQDRSALAHERDQAKIRMDDAERKVIESMLSREEQDSDARYQSAVNAHKQRAQRMRDNEDSLLRLQTQLAGTEGLHQKRIQAEQAVHDATREYDRERLYADAHKHLKELFEQVRQEQVRRTVGPINDRVMNWAKQLGLAEYAGLSFGDQLLPSGMLPADALNGEAIDLQRESYGTLEQLSLLIRLAVGGLLSRAEPAVAILDDPLAHADVGKHRKMLDILARAARGEAHGPHPTGPLQLIILTCHEDRFDYLDGAQQFDLAQLIRRGG